jgi:predicted nucleic-acid-binding Zn-ribbon protein
MKGTLPFIKTLVTEPRGCDMKSGKCPKCQSTDVRVGPPGAGARGPMNKFAVSFWKNVVPERHICLSCGYMEQYVADPADRAAIGSNWPGGSGGSTA